MPIINKENNELVGAIVSHTPPISNRALIKRY